MDFCGASSRDTPSPELASAQTEFASTIIEKVDDHCIKRYRERRRGRRSSEREKRESRNASETPGDQVETTGTKVSTQSTGVSFPFELAELPGDYTEDV